MRSRSSASVTCFPRRSVCSPLSPWPHRSASWSTAASSLGRQGFSRKRKTAASLMARMLLSTLACPLWMIRTTLG